MKRLFFIPLLLVLAACNVISPLAAARPSPTACGCTVKGTPFIPPAGALVPAGPAASGGTPSNLDVFKDQWKTYTNPTYGFTFDYPAVYAGQDYGFCSAREAKNSPQGSIFSVDLGSRTQLTLYKTGDSLASAADAYQKDPTHQDLKFDQPAQRMVGGVPALTLAYRSGGTNRYAETTFFVRNSILYQVDTGTPSACDVPALNITELSAYSRMLDTFQFK